MKTRLKLILWICLWNLIDPGIALTQDIRSKGDTLTQQQFLQGCARYRESVIHDIEGALAEFASLTESLASISAHPETHLALRDGIIQATLKEEHEVSKGSIYRAIQSLAQNDSMAFRLYEDWIEDNSFALTEFQFLVSSQILDPRPPYKLGPLREIWKEFSFYDLHAGMTLADIGAGNGLISFILVESGLPLHIVMTEVDDDFLLLLETKVVRYRKDNTEDSIFVMEAGERELGLGDVKVDRMIFREVYHHLRNPQAILDDIAAHLKEGGYVVLKEGTRDLNDPNHKPCSKATTYKQIIKEFASAGLILVEEAIVDGSYMLKFSR